MRTLSLLALVPLALACNSDKNKSAAGPAGSTSVSSVTSASPSASAVVAKPLACTVEAAVSVDKGARADAGLTLVSLTDGRLALGYATGIGIPKVAIVDTAGKASFVDVEDDHMMTKEKLDPKLLDKATKRTVNRVTPLGFDKGGMKMRVAVDITDKPGSNATILRCGPADKEPYLEQGTPNDVGTGDEGDVLDCRTFSNGETEWVLASLHRAIIGENAAPKEPMDWIVDNSPGKNPVKDAILDEKMYPTATFGKPENFEYQVPVGVGVKGTGYVFAARQEGSLVLVRRSATLEKVGDAVRFGFGAAAPTMPSLALHDHQAAVFFGLFGKTDVYGGTFALEAVPQKPAVLTLDDPSPPTAGDRNSLTASYTPTGDKIFLAFADGAAGAKKARLTVLGSDLKSQVPVFDVGTDSNVAELRVVATGEDKAIVTYLAGGEIKTAQVSCKY